jgi:hypothetical protein
MDPILSLSTLIRLGLPSTSVKAKLVIFLVSSESHHGLDFPRGACELITSLVCSEFTQLMKGLQGERLRQAFHHFDKNQDGYIDPEDFQKIIIDLARHKLSESVLKQLPELAKFTPGGKISYSECIAFHNVSRFLILLRLREKSLIFHRRRSFAIWISSRKFSVNLALVLPMEKSQNETSSITLLARCDTVHSHRWKFRSFSISRVTERWNDSD